MTFPSVTVGLPRDIAIERVTGFAKRFGEPHLNLACHAAFPLILNPDFLYRIWANFLPSIPWIAVADLLLSNLCKEIGFELYEIDITIRDILLKELLDNDRFGNQRLFALAKFTDEYASIQARVQDPDIQDVAQTYHWIANSYIQPSTTARELATALTNPQDQSGTSILRLTQLTNILSMQLGKYNSLLAYSRGLNNRLQGNLQKSIEEFGNAELHGDRLEIDGLYLQVPEEILALSKKKIVRNSINDIILYEFPYPFSVNFLRLQEVSGFREKVGQILNIFNFLIHFLDSILISQYLVDKVSDSYLNGMLEEKFPRPTLGNLVDIFFKLLQVYNNNPEKTLFLPELYDLFSKRGANKPNKGVREPFDKIVQIRNNVIAHGLPPGEDSGWEAVFRELQIYLLQAFEKIHFISNYDLIHITRQEGRLHYYQLYRGQHIVEIEEPIKSDKSLEVDWIYLAKGKHQDIKLLRLYPFLIAWEKDVDLKLPGLQSDVAMLDKFSDSRIQFIATTLWETVQITAESFLADFFNNFERPLRFKQREEQNRFLRKKLTRITWDSVRLASIDLSTRQVGAVYAKYDKAVYLQRKDTLKKFRAFLASDKHCFVLTGKSGVGKSNFVFSLKYEFSKKGDNTCFLIYNAARLSATENITQMISQDFSRSIPLVDQVNQDLLKTLEDSREMEGKLFVVVFDAINENIDGKTLLRNIDRMIAAEDYPWFKVVITSRSESWKTLKRGIPMAEALYYSERDLNDLRDELPEFTIQLDQFNQEELPLVYVKYQKKYLVETNFEELSFAIQNSLRDPLILRLVAEIYTNRKIPGTLRLVEIYDLYIQTLLKSERLFTQDLWLLEQEIMPLMINEKHCSNRLSDSQINSARTRDGHPLWELISNDDTFSNGKRVNESFTRLVDAGILELFGTPMDFEIGFSSRYMFDYFAGRIISKIFHQINIKDKDQAYETFISRCINDQYLIEPVKIALLGDLNEFGDHKWIANSLHQLGTLYQNQGENHEALLLYERSLDIEQKLGDRASMVNNLYQIGDIHFQQGEYLQALEYFQRSLKIAEEISDRAGVAISLRQIGDIHFQQGEYLQALEYYQRSLKIEEKIGNWVGIAKSLNQIGLLYQQQGEYPQALEFHRRSLQIENKVGDQAGIANCLSQMGLVYQQMGEYPQALESAGAIRDESARAKVLSTLAERLPEGQLEQVLEYARAIKNEGERAKVLSALAGRLPEGE